MGLKYTIPFKTTGNRGYCVRISTPSWTGAVTELTGAPSCVTIHQSGDDDLLTPLRHKNATISILTDKILMDLFSTAPMTNRVQVFKGSFDFNDDFNEDFMGNAPVIVWSGWIKPEVYTQDWQHDKAVMQLECESDLAVLSSLDYSPNTAGSLTVESLGSMLSRAVTLTGGFYKTVTVPGTYSFGSQSIGALSVSEHAVLNGFTNEAKTWAWALEQWCTLLGWTLCEHGDELIFVDALATKNAVSYKRYMIGSIGTGAETVTPVTIGVDTIKRRNTTGQSIDVVKSVNYCQVTGDAKDMDGAYPQPDYDDTDTLLIVPATTYYPLNDKYYSTYKELRLPKDHTDIHYGWTLYHYLIKSDGTTPSRTPAQLRANASSANNYAGGMLVRAQMLESNDTEHTLTERNMNLENAVQVRTRSKTYNTKTLPADTPCVTLRIPSALYQGAANRYYPGPTGLQATIKTAGALLLDFSVMFHSEYDLTWNGEAVGTGTLVDDLKLRVQIKAGNWYYNAAEGKWLSLPSADMRYSEITFKTSGKHAGIWSELDTNKRIFMPYDTEKGYVIPMITSESAPLEIEGDIEVTFMAGESLQGVSAITGYTLKNLEVKYLRPTFVLTPTNKVYKVDESNGGYKTTKEISCSFTSHEPDHGHCWGDVSLDGAYLESVTNSLTSSAMRPEELTAYKVTTLYSTPRVKLTEHLRLSNVKPCDMLTDPSLSGKKFMITGRETDLEYERERLTVVEV